MEEQEQEVKQPKPRGGARIGAGRKPKNGVGTIKVSVKLRKDVAEILREEEENVSKYIEKAILDRLKREGRFPRREWRL